MSKINIQGTIDNIKSKSNVYTPLTEAIVNSIDSIITSKITNGKIIVLFKRETSLFEDVIIPNVQSIDVTDNGLGFTTTNRDSFDTLYSTHKKVTFGGKGFGRFMFLKYFSEVTIESNYKEEDGKYYLRKFGFGRKDEIIVGEDTKPSEVKENSTTLHLKNLQAKTPFDKELETIARKLMEKLLIFFISDTIVCPTIVLRDSLGEEIILNNYLKGDNEIKLIETKHFEIFNSETQKNEKFTTKTFQVYYSRSGSKIILTGNNREVTETPLSNYVPEFEDEFYDEVQRNGEGVTKRNYVVKTYVLGDYLDANVSLERESFNFSVNVVDVFSPICQNQIEYEAAELTQQCFNSDVKLRAERKKQKVYNYVNSEAPWHKTYIADVDISLFPYNITEERIELELQKYKFSKEQENKKTIRNIITTNAGFFPDFDKLVNDVVNEVTDLGKSDLAHYVCSRKVVLSFFEDLRKRNDAGKASLEKEIHSLIFPMNKDTTNTNYEDHNLWLLDERLVFSEYVASDRKINKTDSTTEPDLVVFDRIQTYRNGNNEFSNPITIFEFKRPKRKNYTAEENPIVQIGDYLEEIRAGKYEIPDGVEKIKANDSTPAYAYIIADLEDRIKDFARQASLTISPDTEGYFGFHTGYKMYVQIISFKKLINDATLRNKIFFKKLNLE